MMHGKHREDRFNAPSTAEQMPRHRFGRVDDHAFGMVAEGELDRIGLVHITQRGRGAVRIEVLNLARVQSGIAQGGLHRTLGPVHTRRRHVERVRTHAEPAQLGVDSRTPASRMLVLLEDHDTGTFAQYKTVAVLVPGARRRVRIVIARGQGARRGEPTHTQRRNSRLGTSGHHHIGVTIFNDATRLADAMQSGGASRCNGEVRALKAEVNGNMPGDHVDDRSRHEKWRNPSRTARNKVGVSLFDQRQSADARADHAADAFRLLFIQRIVGLQAGVPHRLNRRRHPVVDEGIHVPGILGREIVFDIEPLHFTGESARQRRGIELGDQIDSAAPRQQIRPALGHAVADRTDQAQPGNDHATPIHRINSVEGQDGAVTSRCLLMLDGVVDRELHGRDLFCFFVGNLDAELVFQRHHQFDCIEGIGTQVGNERLGIGHVGFRHAKLLSNDFLDPRFDIAHDSSRSNCKKQAGILRPLQDHRRASSCPPPAGAIGLPQGKSDSPDLGVRVSS